MKSRFAGMFVAIGAALLIGPVLPQNEVRAQKGAAPVTVTNTAANPIPVTGNVTVANTPTVDARQSGDWNVGIAGTPTVQIDPNANTVKVTRTKNYQRAEQINWTGQSQDAWTTNGTDLFDKISVCVGHAAPNTIQVNVYSFVSGSENAFYLTRDAFLITSPNTVCKEYNLLGAATQVQILNNGNNTTGLTRVGIVGH